jgi:hypothetical protein
MALLLAALPAGVGAQSQGWDRAIGARSVQVAVGRPSDAMRRRAPAFCRSGAGHPVHGRRWCVDKGYVTGRAAAYGVRWERRNWHGVVFARVGYRTRVTHIEGRALYHVVGRATWARLERERRRLGGRYALTGRWLRPRPGVRVLQVRSGPVLVAELTDLNGDRRVDVVLVASRLTAR